MQSFNGEQRNGVIFFPLAGVIKCRTEFIKSSEPIGTNTMYYLTQISDVKVCMFYHLKSQKL